MLLARNIYKPAYEYDTSYENTPLLSCEITFGHESVIGNPHFF